MLDVFFMIMQSSSIADNLFSSCCIFSTRQREEDDLVLERVLVKRLTDHLQRSGLFAGR